MTRILLGSEDVVQGPDGDGQSEDEDDAWVSEGVEPVEPSQSLALEQEGDINLTSHILLDVLSNDQERARRAGRTVRGDVDATNAGSDANEKEEGAWDISSWV